ncbi:pyruvate-formate lyase-activating enzyme [Clostridium sp. CAG:762]|jgi:anaerobic ribonucleoside-triphosphate reductase activating protein|nr:pyruvate-formate lyase-activating enzyme [Clostridium sp. CAG:762]
MTINGMQKLTLLDYPGNVACLIFTQGCNFRCPFCHNSGLLDMNNNCEKIDEKEVFKYLEKRRGLLDGVCISGGEPLLQKDIVDFIRKVKDLGYKVKLDTNGSSPKKLKQLIEDGLIDYVAMDIKNDFLNYDKTAGMCTNIDNIKKSIEIIENSNIEYEFRTTIVKQFHDVGKLEKIIQYIGPNARYYIQNYQDCSSVLQRGLNGFDNEELLNIKNTLGVKYPNLVVRGV